MQISSISQQTNNNRGTRYVAVDGSVVYAPKPRTFHDAQIAAREGVDRLGWPLEDWQRVELEAKLADLLFWEWPGETLKTLREGSR